MLYLGGIDLPMPQARAVQTLHTAHALASLGCPVTLAVGRAPRGRITEILTDYGLAPHPRLTIQPLPTLRLPRLPINAYVHPRLAAWNWSYGLAAVMAVLLIPARARPSMVMARDPRLADLFLKARRLTGADVIYEVHELFSTRAREPVSPNHSGQRAAPPTRTPRVRRLEERVFQQAKHLITLTQACRDLLVSDFGVDTQRILVAPDAVASVPVDLPPLSDPWTVIYAGQLYPWKGVGTLVKALALLPGVRLKIVGGLAPGDAHALALRQLAGRENVLSRIEITGFLPHTRVAEVIRGAAAAVVPLPDNPMSRYFTSPLKLYEYMAVGLPIVASDLPAIREVLKHEHNALLVSADDPAQLAAALQRLLSDTQLANRLRAQAHADAKNRTWQARARDILEFIGRGDGRGSHAARL